MKWENAPRKKVSKTVTQTDELSKHSNQECQTKLVRSPHKDADQLNSEC